MSPDVLELRFVPDDADVGYCYTCGCADCDQAGRADVDPMDPPDCSCVGEDGEITC